MWGQGSFSNGTGPRRPRSPKRRSSRSPSKRAKSPSQVKFLHAVGTLGTVQFDDKPRSTNTRYSTVGFTQNVKTTFRKKPGVYKRFVNIMREVQWEGIDKIDIIKRVIMLFDGYPSLILGFNAFLPEEYCIEIQDDAVVIKVFETSDTPRLADTGHVRSYNTSLLGTTKRVDSEPRETEKYVQMIKRKFHDEPAVFKRFSLILSEYHSQEVDAVDTVHRIVSLFQTSPSLVLGFNAFLPPGCSVHMYESDGYVIEYPGENGEKEISRITTSQGGKK